MNEQEIREKITAAIKKTEELIIDYKDMTQPVSPDNAIGRVSRMDAINNNAVTAASLRQAEEKLKALRRVEQQIGTDKFGKCMKCGAEIPVGRILFRPESLLCMRCAR
ncbi:MAG: TraR/DksA C4-type zinc finger protein [Bacteroidales bacterium]|jgi:DnaK suppressor protein|nr:TraR/DksA C4-type zinc finger protein [Bacteroidales bacterium]